MYDTRMITITPEQCVEECKDGLEEEGLSNYQPYYHANLHQDEFKQMSGEEASKFFLKMLEIDEITDCWIASCLDDLYQNKETYGLNEEWFDTILQHQELAIF